MELIVLAIIMGVCYFLGYRKGSRNPVSFDTTSSMSSDKPGSITSITKK